MFGVLLFMSSILFLIYSTQIKTIFLIGPFNTQIWPNLKKIYGFNNLSTMLVKFPKYFKNLTIAADEKERIPPKYLLKRDQVSFDEKCSATIENKSKKFGVSKPDFEFLKTKKGKEYKTILAYHHAYVNNFYFGFGSQPFEDACCKEKRCFMTNDKEKIPLQDFDAVLFHFRDFKKKNLPKQRSRAQRWIFYEREPPPYSSGNPQDYEGVFNWTMTYRWDSDIVAGYGSLYSKKEFKSYNSSSYSSSSLEEVMKGKKQPVAWIVSNCKVPSKRQEYVKILQKFMKVDIYGKCGPLKCSRKQNKECYEKLEKNYKFYLSFENNFCKDYITEKFYNILSYYIVPVVRGSGDYAAVAPPHSYINAEDFKTPKDLADYLIYLDNNDTAYIEYFKWKKDYFVISDHKLRFCSLCEKLHNDKEEKIYYDLKEWFLDKAECNKGL